MPRFLITCEHGGAQVPARYRAMLAPRTLAHSGHRACDEGALVMARALARALAAPLIASRVTRLLVDLNRSIGHPQLFSATVRAAGPALRADLIAHHYLPHRQRVEAAIVAATGRGGAVVHIGSHSFTPRLGREVRNADIGLLYDPARPLEAELCRRWQRALHAVAPELRVRRNYPYQGKADGLTSALRRRFEAGAYLGIELEMNQQLLTGTRARAAHVRRQVIRALTEAIGTQT